MEPEEIAERESEIEDEDESEDYRDDDVEERTPYEVLGISPKAARAEIIAAYHELSKQYHPDFQQNRGIKLQELAKREMQMVNWAREEALKRC